ncbi:cytochrome c oxidase subunit II [Chitinophaga sedimenti]|uniref:cytochrome c oxidase subunit II n=1 Tax=Chitinophaga sedimenti TaxID=2033606 RepID=UPI002002BE93|nr:cytochrome c oxidase subunit II [Chitinophaga sedimenti]MCK7557462.1 cytochrome c oxidase subunit II [Chitinophaga sedimenti]
MLDKFEIKVLRISGLLIVVFLFAYCMLPAKRRWVTECIPYDKAYTEPRVTKIDAKTYQVFAVAQMWSFEPASITVPPGSEVDFYVTSKDVVHGFNIAERNVNMMAVYGGISKTTVKFPEPGVYKITCHEYCGTGHQNMQAEIIVDFPKP